MSKDNDLLTMLKALNKDEKKPQPKSTGVSEKGLPEWYKLSKFGKQVFDELKLCIEDRIPILLNGGTGMGKTEAIRAIAKSIGQEEIGFNCYTGMDVGQLIGMWRPMTDGSLEWEDGAVTKAVRTGKILRIDEFSRCPVDIKSRLFGVMDSNNREWVVYEHTEDEAVQVHDDFVVVASANPTGDGYIGTMREDRAMLSRFGAIIDIYEPMADERHALNCTLNDRDKVERMLRFADMLRAEKATYISTRDLHFLALAMKRGVDIQRAIKMTIAPKYVGMESAIMTHARAVFEDMPSVEEVAKEHV